MERKMQSGDRPSGRLFEDLSKLAGGALGAASGLRQDVETLVRTQAAKLVNELDLVKREEFEAVREMASKARLEQELLVARLEKLEIQLSELQEKQSHNKLLQVFSTIFCKIFAKKLIQRRILSCFQESDLSLCRSRWAHLWVPLPGDKVHVIGIFPSARLSRGNIRSK